MVLRQLRDPEKVSRPAYTPFPHCVYGWTIVRARTIGSRSRQTASGFVGQAMQRRTGILGIEQGVRRTPAPSSVSGARTSSGTLGRPALEQAAPFPALPMNRAIPGIRHADQLEKGRPCFQPGIEPEAIGLRALGIGDTCEVPARSVQRQPFERRIGQQPRLDTHDHACGNLQMPMEIRRCPWGWSILIRRLSQAEQVGLKVTQGRHQRIGVFLHPVRHMITAGRPPRPGRTSIRHFLVEGRPARSTVLCSRPARSKAFRGVDRCVGVTVIVASGVNEMDQISRQRVSRDQLSMAGLPGRCEGSR